MIDFAIVSLARDTLQCICCPLLRESTDYLFQYSKNIDEFREEAEKLKSLVLDVNLSVERAKSRGEEIKNQVQDWVGSEKLSENLEFQLQKCNNETTRK